MSTARRYLDAFFRRHEHWAAVVQDTGGAGLCAEATRDLVEMFDRELVRVWGSVYLLDRNERGLFELDGAEVEERVWKHWWCETLDGQIVDPTRAQFVGRIEYLRYDEEFVPEPAEVTC